MGYIVKLSNDIIRVGGNDPKIAGYLKALPEWESIVIPALKQRNELNEKLIGGTHPRDIQISVFGHVIGGVLQFFFLQNSYFTCRSRTKFSLQKQEDS